MNYNTFLLRFGFNPADFKNKEATIVEGDDDSIIYELEQEIHDRTCPNCFNPKTQVKDHDWVEVTLNTTIGQRDYLRIRKTRFNALNVRPLLLHQFKVFAVNIGKKYRQYKKFNKQYEKYIKQ